MTYALITGFGAVAAVFGLCIHIIRLSPEG